MTRPRDGSTRWELDGPHSLDTDLSATYGILKRLGALPPVLKVTVDVRGWPTVETVVWDFLDAPMPPPLPGMAP